MNTEDKGGLSEQDKTLLLTIRANLERNEKGQVEFKPDPNGHWNIVEPKVDGKLIKYFEPAYTVGFDPYSAPTEPIGFIHIKKRQSGRKAAYEEVQRMAKFYGAQIVQETKEPYINHYTREIRRHPLFPKPSLFRRIILWIKSLFK